MYKFFDKNGKILVLRPDMTVPVARMINTKLKDMTLPLKLFYTANVFRVHESLEGKTNEHLDCGVELVGGDGEIIDLEILVTALEVLKALNTRENFKLEIGDVNILTSAIDEMNLNEEDKENIISLINRKSLINLKDYLNNLNIILQNHMMLQKQFRLICYHTYISRYEYGSKSQLLFRNYF